MIRLDMKNYNTILIGKQRKCNGFLIGEETLPSDQSRMMEQAKFIYSPLVFSFYSPFRKTSF